MPFILEHSHNTDYVFLIRFLFAKKIVFALQHETWRTFIDYKYHAVAELQEAFIKAFNECTVKHENSTCTVKLVTWKQILWRNLKSWTRFALLKFDQLQNMFQVPRCSVVFNEKATGSMRNIRLLAVNHRHYLTVLLLQTAVLSLLSTFHCFSKMCQQLKWFL